MVAHDEEADALLEEFELREEVKVRDDRTPPSVSCTCGDDTTGHLGYRLHPEDHATRPPTTQYFNWTITAGTRSPDGVEKRVYLVNIWTALLGLHNVLSLPAQVSLTTLPSAPRNMALSGGILILMFNALMGYGEVSLFILQMRLASHQKITYS
ncbi:hypothetical protein LB503_004674 [Fusarium chuoi]|nr:hypothetical protein LB503_004674 [Fusarium chuoi]